MNHEMKKVVLEVSEHFKVDVRDMHNISIEFQLFSLNDVDFSPVWTIVVKVPNHDRRKRDMMFRGTSEVSLQDAVHQLKSWKIS